MTDDPQTSMSPAALVRIEAAALEALAKRLDDPSGPDRYAFLLAAGAIIAAVRAGHKVVLCGVGKSGLIARKIAATFVSTGTSAIFLHPTEALHGDLGFLCRDDVVLALSYSGETEEMLRLLPAIRHIGAAVASFTGCLSSTLAAASFTSIDVSVDREACGLQLAPTASTTAMLALGDALAIHVSAALGFKAHDFAGLHPGGQLGRRLTNVRKIMHTGDALPQVTPSAAMPAIIHEMSAKRMGLTTVQANGKLLGIISDGDLRRLFERNGPYAFHKTAADIMNRAPLTISPDPYAPEALLMIEQRKITALIVTEDGTQESAVVGVLHIHDLWEIAPKTEERE